LYALVGFGGGGGFASQFQEAASEWIRAASSLHYAGMSNGHHLIDSMSHPTRVYINCVVGKI